MPDIGYWWIAFLAGCGVSMTMMGQTHGIRLFSKPLTHSLGVSMTDFSLAYAFGTGLSAMVLFKVNHLTDIIGERKMTFMVSLLACAALLITSHGAYFMPYNAGDNLIFCFLIFCVFLLRLSMQGLMNTASRNMSAKWFEDSRGKANMLIALVTCAGWYFGIKLIEPMISRFGWIDALTILAIYVYLPFSFLVLIFFRQKPQAYGLQPRTAKRMQTIWGASRQQAFRTYPFWVFTGAITLVGAMNTAYGFHIVEIFREAGQSSKIAFKALANLVLFYSAFSIIMSFRVDKWGVKWILFILCFAVATASFGLIQLNHSYGMIFLIGGMALAQGCLDVIGGLAWPQYFGNREVNAISGRGSSILVAGTALAPYLFIVCHDWFGSFQSGAWFFLAFAILMILMTRGLKPAKAYRH